MRRTHNALSKLERCRHRVVSAAGTLHCVATEGNRCAGSGLYGATGHSSVVDGDNFGDVMEVSSRGPVLLDCWAPETAYEAMGSTAALILAQRWANETPQITNPLGFVARYTLNVAENPELAKHLSVQTTPQVMLLVDGTVADGAGNVSCDLEAEVTMLDLLRSSYSAVDVQPNTIQSPEHKLVKAHRHVRNGNYSEALYDYEQTLHLGLGYTKGADLDALEGISVPEILCAKAAIGLLSTYPFNDEVEEAEDMADVIERSVPRAVRYLGDVRRGLCAGDIHRYHVSKGAVSEKVRTACLHFLQASYETAAMQLLAIANGKDSSIATHQAQFLLARVFTYLTPHAPELQMILSKNPALNTFFDTLIAEGRSSYEASPLAGLNFDAAPLREIRFAW